MRSFIPAATAIGLIHAILSMIIQAESFFLYLYRPDDGCSQLIKFLLLLPISQFEHIMFSLLMAVPAIFILYHFFFKWIYFAILIAINVYLVLDQVIYSVFFDHYRLSQSEGRVASVAMLWDSIQAEVDTVFYVNLAILLVATIFVYQIVHRPKSVRGSWIRVLYWLQSGDWKKAVIGFVCIANVALWGNAENNNLEHHPIFALICSDFSSNNGQSEPLLVEDDLYTPRFGKITNNSVTSRKLQQVLESVRQRNGRPNVVFIVMESVGALQLLEDGKLSARNTPNLASRAEHMVLFDSVYNTFPGTVRTHAPINTGGRTITWGSVYDEFSMKYRGPILANELKKYGYHTALVSAGNLSPENMGDLYKGYDYDYFFEPGMASENFIKENQINSWGVSEDSVRKLAIEWIDAVMQDDRPFFLQFLTISTHHPYSVPAGYTGPHPGTDKESRYYNSLHYNDWVLGHLFDDLKKRRLLDNTIVVICGDHGQAFGRRHRKNFTHKNFLYEENIRNFCLIIDRASIERTVVSHRTTFVGDIMPTILGLAGATISSDVLGQNLFDSGYQQRLVYFHKNTHPELWGLRDGRWKFIAQKTRVGKPELYDLETDPEEQNNIATQHPEQVELYQRLCRQWFVQTNTDYCQRLEDYEFIGGRGLNKDEVSICGPKILAFGHKPENGKFVELSRIHPHEDMVAWTKWVSYPQDKTVKYKWTSPSGRTRSFTFTIRADWSTTWVYHHADAPMEEGIWTLALYDGDRKLTSGSFLVADDAPLVNAHVFAKGEDKHFGPRSLSFGYKPENGEVMELKEIHPCEDMVVATRWDPYRLNRVITYEWTAPSGRRTNAVFNVHSGWTTTWVYHDAELPMEEGRWQLSLFHGDTLLITSSFHVNGDAALITSQTADLHPFESVDIIKPP